RAITPAAAATTSLGPERPRSVIGIAAWSPRRRVRSTSPLGTASTPRTRQSAKPSDRVRAAGRGRRRSRALVPDLVPGGERHPGAQHARRRLIEVNLATARGDDLVPDERPVEVA